MTTYKVTFQIKVYIPIIFQNHHHCKAFVSKNKIRKEKEKVDVSTSCLTIGETEQTLCSSVTWIY